MSNLFGHILLLKKTPVFSEVNTADLRFVVQALEEEWYFTGERVFDIHDQGEHMYFILEGKVGISIDPDPRRQIYVATLGPGDAFGEMNLLNSLPRSATAHVLENSRLLALEKNRLRGLILSYPELGLGMLTAFSQRLRDAEQQLHN